MTLRLGLAPRGHDPGTDSLLEAISGAADSMDIRPGWLRRSEDEDKYDAVLAVGPPQAYARLFESPPAATRISWFGEPLPRGSDAGARFGHRPGLGFSGGLTGALLRAARHVAGPLKSLSPPGRLGALREIPTIENERVDNLRLVRWCTDHGARIVVTSQDRRASLAAAGIHATAVPFGYHPSHAGLLMCPASPRDIEVVIVGIDLHSNRRRGRILARLRPELQRLGRVVEIDGRWGEERDTILRRARVILDIQRVPGNFTGLRWLLASAAGAVYVVERMDDPAPFRVGIDHIEAPTDSLIDEVARLLADEPRRRSIADQAQAMLRGDLAMDRCLARVLTS